MKLRFSDSANGNHQQAEGSATKSGGSLYDRVLNDSGVARVAAVTGQGLLDAVPGAAHAAVYDTQHFKSRMLPNILATAALTVGTSVLLPESRALKVAGGLLFGKYLAQDAVKPTISAWSKAYHGDANTVSQAAKQMGDGLGDVAWNMAWSLPLSYGVNLAAGRALAAAGAGDGGLVSKLPGLRNLGGVAEGRVLVPGAVSPAMSDSAAGEMAEPFNLTLVGAAGDLSKRKLIPALYELYRDGHFPDRFSILGTAREGLGDHEFRQFAKDSLGKYASDMPFDEQSWQQFASHLYYHRADLTDMESVRDLKSTIDGLNQKYGTQGHNLFYLSTQPSIFGRSIENLAGSGLLSVSDVPAADAWPRVAIEKPFGHDLASAEKLDHTIHQHIAETQAYRVDHYLGKPAVQDILEFRLNNGLYEPVWNRHYISGMSINHAETLGIEGGRGNYYDGVGAWRDMGQNHLMQVLSHLTMEPPSGSFTAQAIRDAKTQVLNDMRPIDPQHLDDVALRGQYGAGSYDGKPVIGYRQEQGVSPTSNRETFAAVNLGIDNERWAGVPMSIRTGKRLPQSITDVVVGFKPPGERPPSPLLDTPYGFARRIEYRIQPNPKASLLVATREFAPETTLSLDHEVRPANELAGRTPTGYERLFLDFLKGNPERFTRSDFVEASWAHWQPLLDNWDSTEPRQTFPNYAANTWGPTGLAGSLKIPPPSRVPAGAHA